MNTQTHSAAHFSPVPFQARRAQFFQSITKGGANAVAVLPASPEFERNHDVHFKFRQDSNFFYLTGFKEPDAIAVLRAVNGKQEYILFVRPKDLAKEIWTGYRCGPDAAVSQHGATRAYPIDEFQAQFPALVQGADHVYYSFRKSMNRNGVEWLDDKIVRLLNEYRQSLGRTGRGMPALIDPTEILGEMRLFKKPEEQQRIRRAIDISAVAHIEAMARTRPGITEYQIDALLEFMFHDAGAERHGYPSIVASGQNSTILHYTESSRTLTDGDLLLIDAGAEFEYYSADITRTFPVNGKYSQPQKALYDLTLDVQKECLKMVRPGATMASIHQFAVNALTDGMISLGFLKGARQQLVESLAYKRYYPHGTGHFLGIDVHDAGLYQMDGEPRKLEPGMLFTIEPGFYVLHDDTNAPASYRGIGIRIEDNVLVTPTGCDVLTRNVPKEIAEMSAIIGSKPWVQL